MSFDNNLNTSNTPATFEPFSSTTAIIRLCRMSWFLVQQMHTNIYSIIHQVNLIHDMNAEIYLNRTIRFQRDQSIIEAIMICASDNRQFVEDELKKRLTDSNRIRRTFPDYLPLELQIQESIETWFLLQFNRNENCIVHMVLERADIPWLINDKCMNTREILIDDGNAKRLTTILHYSGDEMEIKNEMELLKSKYAYLAFDDSTLNKTFKWLLVQYSDDLNNVIHAVINEDETVWSNENFSNDYVTYLRDNTNTIAYQALILKRAQYYENLEAELVNMKEKILLSKYGKKNRIVPDLTTSTSELIENL